MLPLFRSTGPSITVAIDRVVLVQQGRSAAPLLGGPSKPSWLSVWRHRLVIIDDFGGGGREERRRSRRRLE